MTITATTNKVAYAGDGATVSFPVTFIYWDDTGVKVILSNDTTGVETTWVDGTQYTLTGGNGATGTLTVDTSPTDYTPASGETLTVKSNEPDTQTTSLALGGPLPSTSIEERFDKNVRLVQQLQEELDRTPKYNESSTTSAITIKDPVALELLRMNAANDEIEGVSLSDLSLGLGTALKWNFDTSISMADPGSGDIRFDNATLASVANIAVSKNSSQSGSPDISDFVANWGASDSTVKAHLVIFQDGSPSNFWIGEIDSAVTDNTAWLQIVVTHVDSGGSFSASDNLVVMWSRTGDKGETGATGSTGPTGPSGSGSFDFSTTADPTVNDDASDTSGNGTFSINSQWTNETTKDVFTCKDATATAAVWKKIHTEGQAINEERVTVAGSATASAIWAALGNQIDYTGTPTVTDFPAAPHAGAIRTLHIASTPTFTDAGNISVMGDANYTAEAGDIVVVHAITTTTFRLVVLKKDGTPIVPQGSGYKYIKTETASTSSTIDLDNLDTTTYKEFKIVFWNVHLSVATDIELQIIEAGAGTVISTSTYFGNCRGSESNTTANTILTNHSDSATEMTLTVTTVSTSYEASGHIYLIDIGKISTRNTFRGHCSYGEAGGRVGGCVFEGLNSSQDADGYRGIRLKPSSGTFVTGTFDVYGLLRS